MELRITCEGSDLIDYKTIKNLQGSLKTRTMDDIEEMIKSLIQHGFSFPMFVYKQKDANYAIDGHGRLLALSMMEKNGYWLDKGELKYDGKPWTIPSVPCVYIEAKDLAEAKIKLLKLNSEYGTITQIGFEDFTKDLAVSKYSGIPLKIVEVDAIGDIDPLSNISEIIPLDIGEEPAVPDDESSNEIGTDFEPSLDPQIDTSVITRESIEKATEKEHGKEGLSINVMQFTCKHCGRALAIRKSDVNFLINQKIKELSNG